MKKTIVIIALLFSAISFSQGSPDYGGGLKVNINQDGSKYFRIISWSQFWAQNNSDRPLDANGNQQSETNFSIRRARVLMYAQITKDFMILTHFGLNSLNADNLSPVGTKDASQLFYMTYGVNIVWVKIMQLEVVFTIGMEFLV